jgi:hypothetical protein
MELCRIALAVRPRCLVELNNKHDTDCLLSECLELDTRNKMR